MRVRAAGINPGEIAIREGVFAERWPATFPSGEGSDLAGVVEEAGPGVDAFAVGDEVLGWTDERASHAELVVAPVAQLTALSWEVAGSLYVAGLTALAAVRVVAPGPGDVVVVSAAAGGVGVYATQLARETGATVIGLASERNHAWLRAVGALPVAHGDGVEERIREASGGRVDAVVDLALRLGVAKERITTIIDFAAAAEHGLRAEGSSEIASAETLSEVAGLVAAGRIEVPIAATYPLEQVRDAYARLAERATHGKIVLVP